MQLRQLEYLVALDRERHFGRAAGACHVSQPALSTAIRGLERELAVPLVKRSGRFEGFTEEGERVLQWARRALADVQGLEQEVQRLRAGLEGTLRLGAIPTSLAASTLVSTRFRQRHARMRVQLSSATTREIAQGLAAGDLDAGLMYLDNEPLPDVVSLPLWRERYLLVCPAGLLPVESVSVTWARAAQLPHTLLTEDMQHRRIVDAAFRAAGGEPDPVVVTNSVSALIGHAQSGLVSVTTQAWLAVHPLPLGLRAIPLVEPVVEHAVGLVTPAGGQQSPVVSELMALFEPFELDEHLRVAAAGGSRSADAPVQ